MSLAFRLPRKSSRPLAGSSSCQQRYHCHLEKNATPDASDIAAAYPELVARASAKVNSHRLRPGDCGAERVARLVVRPDCVVRHRVDRVVAVVRAVALHEVQRRVRPWQPRKVPTAAALNAWRRERPTACPCPEARVVGAVDGVGLTRAVVHEQVVVLELVVAPDPRRARALPARELDQHLGLFPLAQLRVGGVGWMRHADRRRVTEPAPDVQPSGAPADGAVAAALRVVGIVEDHGRQPGQQAHLAVENAAAVEAVLGRRERVRQPAPDRHVLAYKVGPVGAGVGLALLEHSVVEALEEEDRVDVVHVRRVLRARLQLPGHVERRPPRHGGAERVGRRRRRGRRAVVVPDGLISPVNRLAVRGEHPRIGVA